MSVLGQVSRTERSGFVDTEDYEGFLKGGSATQAGEAGDSPHALGQSRAPRSFARSALNRADRLADRLMLRSGMALFQGSSPDPLRGNGRTVRPMRLSRELPHGKQDMAPGSSRAHAAVLAARNRRLTRSARWMSPALESAVSDDRSSAWEARAGRPSHLLNPRARFQRHHPRRPALGREHIESTQANHRP